jgi:hypothetical protein
MADTMGQNVHGYDHDNLRHVVITSTCFAFILSTTAVSFRIISRAINGSGLFLDDWLIILALVSERNYTIYSLATCLNKPLSLYYFSTSPLKSINNAPGLRTMIFC